MRGADRGGWGCDAAWADDFHHALRVALTGETDGWYEEFARPGHARQGLPPAARPRRHVLHLPRPPLRRAGADDVPPERFVVFSSDHDQVGNRAYGDRPPVEARPLAALLTCLAPFTPMLFQGEEHGEVAPFRFFSDHIDPEIAEATREGRRREFAAFAAFGEEIPDPQDPMTFQRSKLTRRGEPAGLRALYRDALALRPRLRADGPRGRRRSADGRRLTVRRGPLPHPRQLRRRALAAGRRAAA